MSYTIVIGCIAAVWAFLSLLGNAEATRRDAEREAKAAAPPMEPPAS